MSADTRIKPYRYDLSDDQLYQVALRIANQTKEGYLSFSGLQMQIFESLKRVRDEAEKVG